MEKQLTVWDVIVQGNPDGVTQVDLQRYLPSISVEIIAEKINELLKGGKIEIFKKAGGVIHYKAVSAEQTARVKGLTQEEKLLYQLIEAEGNMGLWVRDMRFKSGLKPVQISKTLRTLQSRRLVKEVKSIAGRNRRVYMLYDLEPSVKVKGNAFYTADGLFDAEFVKILSAQLANYISKRGWTSLEELSTFVQVRNLSTVELRLEELQAIVNTLIYDGKVEEIKRQDGEKGEETYLYKPTRLALPRNGLTEPPCGRCPVFHLCHDDGEISPQKCPYMQAWLAQELDW